MLISNYYFKLYSLNSLCFSDTYRLNTYNLNNRTNSLVMFANIEKNCLNDLVVYSNRFKNVIISLNELFVYPNDNIIINIKTIGLNSYVDLNISYIKYNNLYFAKSTNTFIKLSQNPFINVSKVPNMTRFKVCGWFKSGFNRFRGKFWF